MNSATATKPKRVFAAANSGLTPYAGVWGEEQIIHLLRRAMFGATRADINHFLPKSMNATVDELLSINTTPPPPPINTYSDIDPDVPIGQTWVNTTTNGVFDGQRRASWKAWRMGLLINQERSILEKMTLFLHNHFATETNDVSDARYTYKHHALLRSNALGNFKNLVRLVTTDPAMLVYLNGRSNNKTAPDENYGRELQELFTVGKALEPHYTESDVKAAAKVLTGWQDVRTTISSVFTPNRHDTTNKQFSSFYNNTVITGVTGATGGATELDAMLNMIFAHPEVAKAIARKVYTFFVYYTIDASIEANVITPMADIFRNSGYELKPMIEALLKSEHFYDVANKACIIKSPLDFLVGNIRTLGVQFPNVATDAVNTYKSWIFVAGYSAVLQQDLGDPPNVAGWAAYYQAPQYHELWINSATLPNRNKFTDGLSVGVNVPNTGNAVKLKMDTVAFTKTLANPADPNSVINETVKLIHGLQLSTASKNAIKLTTLNGNLATDTSWTTVWNTLIADPTNAAKITAVENRLKGLYVYLMRLSEFQVA